MQNKLTAPSAKDLYFKSVLLFLANDDAIGAAQALHRYLNNDPTFAQTRQQKFVQALITSVKEQDLALFSNEWYPSSYPAISSTKSSPSISGRPPSSPRSNPTSPRRAQPTPANPRPPRRSPNSDSLLECFYLSPDSQFLLPRALPPPWPPEGRGKE